MLDIPDMPWWAAAGLCLLTWLVSKGVDAVIRLRKHGMEERHSEEDRHMAGYQLLIGELKARVTKLEEVLKEGNEKYERTIEGLRQEHISCLENQASLTAQIVKLDEQVKALWRHDAKNQEQIAANKAGAEALRACSKCGRGIGKLDASVGDGLCALCRIDKERESQ